MAASLVIFAVALVILLGVSALFSAAETALTGASRGRMHQLEREGDPGAKRVNKLLDDQETMIGAVLLGYNAINIAASAVATEFITKSIPGAWGVAADTGVMTVLVLVFAEVLPKTIAINKPDQSALALARPVSWVVALFGPLTMAIEAFVRVTLRAFRFDASASHVLSATDEMMKAAISATRASIKSRCQPEKPLCDIFLTLR